MGGGYRESNYDLLRILSCVAVIILHISSSYIAEAASSTGGFRYTGNLFVTYIFDTITRFAVPCFVMMSGAFLLADKRNADVRYFYSKSMKKTGSVTIVFSLLYFLYVLLRKTLNVAMGEEPVSSLMLPVKNLLFGKPFYHMWYLYMLLGLYILTPLILILDESLKERKINIFGKSLWIFLACASLSYWTGTYTLSWDVGMQFQYLSLFMAGYVIRMWAEDRKSSVRGMAFIVLGLLIELSLALCRYYAANGTIRPLAFEVFAYEGLDPIVVVASLLIFSGFSMLEVKGDLSCLSADTFVLFLFHAGVIELFQIFAVRKVRFLQAHAISVLIAAASVFFISLLLTRIFSWAWRYVGDYISQVILKVFGLGPDKLSKEKGEVQL